MHAVMAPSSVNVNGENGGRSRSHSPVKPPEDDSPVVVRRRGRDVNGATASLRRPKAITANRRTKSSDHAPKQKSSLLQDYTRGHASVGTYAPKRRTSNSPESRLLQKTSIMSAPQSSPVMTDLPQRRYPKAKPKPGELLDFSGLLSDTSDSTHNTMNDDSGQSVEELIQFRVRNPNTVTAKPPPPPPPPAQPPQPQQLIAASLLAGRGQGLDAIVEEDKQMNQSRFSITSVNQHTSSMENITSSNHSTISSASGGSSTHSRGLLPGSSHHSSAGSSSHHSRKSSASSSSSHHSHKSNNNKPSLLGRLDDSCTSFADDNEFLNDHTTKTGNVRGENVPSLSKYMNDTSNTTTSTRGSLASVSIDPNSLFHLKNGNGGSNHNPHHHHHHRDSNASHTTQRDSLQSAGTYNTRDSTATYNTRDSMATYNTRDSTASTFNPRDSTKSTATASTFNPRGSHNSTTSMRPSRDSILMGKPSANLIRESLVSPPHSPKPPTSSGTAAPLHPTARLLQAAAKAVEAPPQKKGGRRQRRNTATEHTPNNSTSSDNNNKNNNKLPGLRRTQTADTSGNKYHGTAGDPSMEGSGRIKRGSTLSRSNSGDDHPDGTMDDSGADNNIGSSARSRGRNPLRRSQSSDGCGSGPLGRMRRAGRRNNNNTTTDGEVPRLPVRTKSSDGSVSNLNMRGRALRRSATQGDGGGTMDASEIRRNGFRRSKSSVEDKYGDGSDNNGGGPRSLSPTRRGGGGSSAKDTSFGANHQSTFNASRIKRWDKDEVREMGLSTSNFGGHEFEKMLKSVSAGLYHC
ncbi:expressed unknown protein [Seminavis robusta]|uniref:Uncharacterized protein n=1 Tax=Seminavis robusta TaxID=568900 RepID=A0A9N8E596_9STRA|nr:expressed unknown protein [Seminavis robusta]|eukprot:Sro532_g161450.1 n/a (800) ;mRNA; f:22211-24610